MKMTNTKTRKERKLTGDEPQVVTRALELIDELDAWLETRDDDEKTNFLKDVRGWMMVMTNEVGYLNVYFDMVMSPAESPSINSRAKDIPSSISRSAPPSPGRGNCGDSGETTVGPDSGHTSGGSSNSSRSAQKAGSAPAGKTGGDFPQCHASGLDTETTFGQDPYREVARHVEALRRERREYEARVDRALRSLRTRELADNRGVGSQTHIDGRSSAAPSLC